MNLKARRDARQPSPEDSALRAALEVNDWPLLLETCRRTLEKHPRHLRAHRFLGFALNKLHREQEAVEAYEAAIAVWPEDAELLVNYAGVLHALSRQADAYPILHRAVLLRPDHAMVWVKLAQSCYAIQKFSEGFDAAEKGCQLASNDADRVAALNQRSIHRRELGQTPESVRDCDEAIRLAPLDPSNHTNRLLFMLSDASTTVRQIVDAAREFGNTFEAYFKPHWPDFKALRHGPWRRLKVAFLSADFRTHSVMYFMEGLLAQLDRRQFEVFAVHLLSYEDNVTERVEKHVDHFVRVANFSPDEQAGMLRGLDLDIAIDLSGHTGGNALLTFAHRIAPVQISWLGYPATTGLTAMNYRFTDDVTDPPGVDDQYTEQLFRLPTFFCCYRPMIREPLWRYQPAYEVQPTPALRHGHITFGSCNNLGKLTDEVLSLWGRLLERVPGARLLIEGKNLDVPEFAASYRSRCVQLGIDTTRLDLLGLNPANQYLTYHRIDIALDPFPLTGGTTSCDVLWMGVPLVSLVGDCFKSRMSTGILAYLGHAEWLADTQEAYLQIATTLASDVQHLNGIRMGLRREFENSMVMREDLFCQHYGHALRVMWLQWLASGLHPGDENAQLNAIQSWLPERPPQWDQLPAPGIGLSPGRRVPLVEAHEMIDAMVSEAKSRFPQPRHPDGQIHDPIWIEITQLATTILSAAPHDAVALACLAEVEHAHGHTDFAVTYLRRAEQSLRASVA